MKDITHDADRLSALRDRLQNALVEQIDNIQINGNPESRLPHMTNITFGGTDPDTLTLATCDVAVSAGSACTSHSMESSYVLACLRRAARAGGVFDPLLPRPRNDRRRDRFRDSADVANPLRVAWAPRHCANSRLITSGPNVTRIGSPISVASDCLCEISSCCTPRRRKRLWQGGIALLVVVLTFAIGNAFVSRDRAVTAQFLGHDFLAFYTAGTLAQARFDQLYDLDAVRHAPARAIASEKRA